MKDHARVKKHIDLEGDLEEVIKELRIAATGLVNPSIEVEYFGNDGYSEHYIIGWRPMNEKELADAERRRQIEKDSKKRAKEKKEAEELAEYERLKKKFENA
jgi:hypothetical protein